MKRLMRGGRSPWSGGGPLVVHRVCIADWRWAEAVVALAMTPVILRQAAETFEEAREEGSEE